MINNGLKPEDLEFLSDSAESYNMYQLKLIRWLYFFIFLSSISLKAQENIWTAFEKFLKTEKTSQGIKKCADLNKDGKPDLCFYYSEDGYLQMIKQDWYFKGNWDYIANYGTINHPRDEKMIQTDKSHKEIQTITDGAEFLELKIQRYVNDQLIETEYKYILDESMQANNCTQGTDLKSFMDQLSATVNSTAKDKDGFISTPFGLKIDPTCVQKRKNAVAEFTDSVKASISCLQKLNTTKAQEHILKFKSIFQGTPPLKVICNETKGYDWAKTMAHASISPADKTLKHPMVSMNPQTYGGTELNEMKSTFFHESFHTLGYSHGNDIEYAYACEKCCFTNEKDKTVKNDACAICGGNYNSMYDPDYLKHLFVLYKVDPRLPSPIPIIEAALKKDPKNPKLANLLLEIYQSPFDAPLGNEFVKYFQQQKIPLNAKLVESIDYYTKQNYNQVLLDTSSKIFQAKKSADKGDFVGADKILSQIKTPLTKSFNKDDTESFNFSNDHLKEYEKKILFAIWINSSHQEPMDADFVIRARKKYETFK